MIEGLILNGLGHYAISRTILEDVRRQDHSNTLVLTGLTVTYLNLRKRAMAIQCFRECLRQPDFGEYSAAELTEAFLDHEMPAEAALSATLAIRSDSDDSYGWFLLGFAMDRLERARAAELCYRQSIALDHEQWLAWSALGLFYFYEERDREAKACWEAIPMNEHFNQVALAAWRSLLRHGDPRIHAIRNRWNAIRITRLSESSGTPLRQKKSNS